MEQLICKHKKWKEEVKSGAIVECEGWLIGARDDNPNIDPRDIDSFDWMGDLTGTIVNIVESYGGRIACESNPFYWICFPTEAEGLNFIEQWLAPQRLMQTMAGRNDKEE